MKQEGIARVVMIPQILFWLSDYVISLSQNRDLC